MNDFDRWVEEKIPNKHLRLGTIIGLIAWLVVTFLVLGVGLVWLVGHYLGTLFGFLTFAGVFGVGVAILITLVSWMEN